MNQTTTTTRNLVAEYEAWFDKYPKIYQSELLAIKGLMEQLPENILGIEIGLKTGKFSLPLGIKEGTEPEDKMRELAVKRGIDTMDAFAEHLPYKDLHFDFVLYVTVNEIKDLKVALKDAYRVLKIGGAIILAFIDKNSLLGKQYDQKRNKSTFYRHSRFYTIDEITTLLKETKFKNPQFIQTLFGDIDKISEVEEPEKGTGKGSFVVVKAEK